MFLTSFLSHLHKNMYKACAKPIDFKKASIIATLQEEVTMDRAEFPASDKITSP
jgi:hypothetical protein